MIKRGEIYLVNLVNLVNLDSTIGSEVKKTRPCVVVSPNEMNQYIRTIVIAPMATKRRKYKSRVGVSFQGKEGEIMLDQIRTIDKKLLIVKLGKLSSNNLRATLSVLEEMFTY